VSGVIPAAGLKSGATGGASACAARATSTIRQSSIIIRHSMWLPNLDGHKKRHISNDL